MFTNKEVLGSYVFGPFRLDARRRVLVRGPEKVVVTPKALETLVLLVERAGEVVSKDDLLKGVWGDTAVEENNLTQCISAIRKALGENAGENKYIATVPGQGYQFVGSVQLASVGLVQMVAIKRLFFWSLVAISMCGGFLLAWHYLATRRTCREPSGNAYMKGVTKLQELDFEGARDFLEQAAVANGSNPYVHLRLADAWSGLGYDSKAREEASRALELCRTCSPDQRLEFEARFSEAADQWKQAETLYRGLWDRSKDKLDYCLHLANALSEEGKVKEALETIRALRNISVPARYDPRVDLAEADIALAIPDSEMERQAAERAIKEAEDSADPHTKQLISEALLHEGWALTYLGQPSSAQKAFEAALKNFSDAGNQGGRVDALDGMADLLYGQGDLSGAEDTYLEALDVCRDTHYERCASENLCSLGDILRQRGNLAGAEQRYQACLTSSENVADRAGIIAARIGLSKLMIERKKFREAEDNARRALKALEGGSPGLGAVGVYNLLARSLLAQGNVAGARALVERASAIKARSNDRCELFALKATSARVQAASGREQDVLAATAILDGISGDAGRASCYPVGIEARLDMVEIEARSGSRTAIANFIALRKEAAARGFGLIARQTESLERAVSSAK